MQSRSILDTPQRYREIASQLSTPDTLTLKSIISYRTEVAKLLIKEDIEQKFLPNTLSCFSDIHDYTDANLYLIDEEHQIPKAGSFFAWDDLSVSEVTDSFNQVIDTLDKWISFKAAT